jgi:TRAP-type C4-dicarboxylate transport system permease small subunit
MQRLSALMGVVERWIIIASYIYFCVIILAELIGRYIFGYSSEWEGMSARYAFIFLVYVAMAQAARTRGHTRIDLMPARLNHRGRLVLYLYFDLLHLVLVALVCYYSIRVMELQIANDVRMTGADLSMAYAQAALPIGWGLLGFRVLQRAVLMIREFSRSGNVDVQGRAGR